MLSLTLALASFLPLLLPRLDDPFYSDSACNDDCRSSSAPPQPHRLAVHVMGTAASEMDLDFAFGLQILWIELNFVILLLSLCLYEQRISKILVMQMKGRFVVPVSVRLDDL